MQSINADTSVDADTYLSTAADVHGVNREIGDRTWLIIQRKGVDLFTVPNTPEGIIPKLQAAYATSATTLEIVVDYNFFLKLQIYALDNGAWVVKKDIDFFTMDDPTRTNLLLIDFLDARTVLLTFSKNAGDVLRQKKIVHSDDRTIKFEFLGDGKILRNGKPVVQTSPKTLADWRVGVQFPPADSVRVNK